MHSFFKMNPLAKAASFHQDAIRALLNARKIVREALVKRGHAFTHQSQEGCFYKIGFTLDDEFMWVEVDTFGILEFSENMPPTIRKIINDALVVQ